MCTSREKTLVTKTENRPSLAANAHQVVAGASEGFAIPSRVYVALGLVEGIFQQKALHLDSSHLTVDGATPCLAQNMCDFASFMRRPFGPSALGTNPVFIEKSRTCRRASAVCRSAQAKGVGRGGCSQRAHVFASAQLPDL